MKILSIEPRDIYVTFELSVSEIDKLLIGLGLAKIDYNGENKKEVEAAQYIEKKFFPELNKVMQGFQNES